MVACSIVSPAAPAPRPNTRTAGSAHTGDARSRYCVRLSKTRRTTGWGYGTSRALRTEMRVSNTGEMGGRWHGPLFVGVDGGAL